MSKPITSKEKQIMKNNKHNVPHQQLPLPLTQQEIFCLWCQLLICLFCLWLFPSPNEAFRFKKTFTPLSAIHSFLSLDEVFCSVAQPSLSLFLSILLGFVQLFATCAGLSNPITPACSLSHYPPGFKDQLLLMCEGLFCLTVSRNPHWSYSCSYSNVAAPWHQGQCTAHAEVSHQHEAQHQLFNRHLNLLLI